MVPFTEVGNPGGRMILGGVDHRFSFEHDEVPLRYASGNVKWAIRSYASGIQRSPLI